MEIAALTAFLAPFLPTLLRSGGELVEESVQRFGEEALAFARRLWDKLDARIASKEPAREAAEDVAKDPDDPDLRAVLRVQLKKLLEQDPALAEELRKLWEEQPAGATNVVASGSGAIAIGRDVVGSTLNTGGNAPKE